MVRPNAALWLPYKTGQVARTRAVDLDAPGWAVVGYSRSQALRKKWPNAHLGVGVSLLVLVVARGQAAVLMQSLSATNASTSSTR